MPVPIPLPEDGEALRSLLGAVTDAIERILKDAMLPGTGPAVALARTVLAHNKAMREKLMCAEQCKVRAILANVQGRLGLLRSIWQDDGSKELWRLLFRD